MMNFLVLDLEMNQPSGKIIQIGAVVADADKRSILAKISILVNPSEPIDPYITNLTGIKDSDVANGVSLAEAYKQLVEFSTTHQVFRNAVTWGGGDTKELQKQLTQYHAGIFSEVPWRYGHRWIDVKTLFQTYRIANSKPVQGGLSKAMSKMGLSFRGHAHRADWDAENTAYMYFAMLDKWSKV